MKTTRAVTGNLYVETCESVRTLFFQTSFSPVPTRIEIASHNLGGSRLGAVRYWAEYVHFNQPRPLTWTTNSGKTVESIPATDSDLAFFFSRMVAKTGHQPQHIPLSIWQSCGLTDADASRIKAASDSAWLPTT